MFNKQVANHFDNIVDVATALPSSINAFDCIAAATIGLSQYFVEQLMIVSDNIFNLLRGCDVLCISPPLS